MFAFLIRTILRHFIKLERKTEKLSTPFAVSVGNVPSALQVCSPVTADTKKLTFENF